MRVLLIDNHDSYTHNLAHLVASVTGVLPRIVRNDGESVAALVAWAPDAIVISPGPGRPDLARDVGLTPALLAALPRVPVLGVCLGMQLLAQLAGAKVGPATHPRHGRTSPLRHTGTALFTGLPQDFAVMRYHSLAVHEPLPQTLVALAHSDDGELMAIAHTEKPWFGLQFHPESVASAHGSALLAAFFAAPPLHATTLDLWYEPQALFAALYNEAPHAFLIRTEGLSIMGSAVPGSTLQRIAGDASGFATGVLSLRAYEGEDLQLRVDASICCDHTHKRLSVRATTAEAASALAARIGAASVAPLALPGAPRSRGDWRMSAARYKDAIASCQALIRAGEAYELCLTNRFAAKTDASPWVLFLRLLEFNASPYAAFIKSGHTAFISSSPERYVRISKNGDGSLHAQTRPIKGTRRRGRNASEDAAIAQELAAADKDRAENLMIVDVSRHDLGTHACPGSVRAAPLLQVETHPSVFQLVSTVSADMQPGTSAEDIVRALFPPASMTGAPKQRAIAHLRALEGDARGLYAGAFGWIDDRGHADFAVTIRTLIQVGDAVHFGAGGAILLDSDAETEWQEVLAKARPLLRALGI